MTTPYLFINLDRVEAAYWKFRRCFPEAGIFYAVKANPAPEVLRLLARLGSQFDVASPAEADACLAAGAAAGDLSYGNTVKKSCDIAYAYRLGVRLFAFDCQEELDKLAAQAPGAKVLCRLEAASDGAAWPLARKFGCSAESAEALIVEAMRRGLLPWGISFHVGSQQTDPARWEEPLVRTGALFQRLAGRGIHLSTVNLGGGFPARYATPVPDLGVYRDSIRAALDAHLGGFSPHVMLEPGRGLVADAGVIVTQVILKSRREPAGRSWVYLDAGKFGGLAETMDECIQYRIRSVAAAGPEEAVVLAGPTCDSADILYERTEYRLPASLEEGDRLNILSAGAYTASYASIGFNGLTPLTEYFGRGGDAEAGEDLVMLQGAKED